MDWIIHETTVKSSTQYWFMHKEGKAHAKAYIFHDDKKRVLLGELSVTPSARNKGLGLSLQLARENLAIGLGCTESVLYVNIGTWQKEWYKRRGYKYLSRYKGKNAQWLIKELIIKK